MKKADWVGIFPAITTKFQDDLALDLKATETHMGRMLDAGVHGIVVNGTLGENGSLSTKEKLEIIRLASSVCNDKVPVVTGVAENTTLTACRFVEQAAKAGADGLMVLPALQYSADRHEALNHFRLVARSTDLPVMVYNNPEVYGVDTTPDMFHELADEEKIVAIKESSGDVRRVTDIRGLLAERYRIFIGLDDLALEGLSAGAVGWVAGLVCAFPRETVVLYELIRANRMDEARELYQWFMPLLRLDNSPKLVQNIKLAEAMTDYGTEHVRPPRLPLTGMEREQVRRTIAKSLAKRPKLPVVTHSHDDA